ncbi:MAG TPA: serine O-acetyltransferase EpsC [Dyella sp.]|uniref:serine O-acetyltransferase EpsC n=1 Tax=Dyella sp. TaxID=1869338 RepID=UPI002F9553B6
MRNEAESQCWLHAELRPFLNARILMHESLPRALASLLALDIQRLDASLFSLQANFAEVLQRPHIAEAVAADLRRTASVDLCAPGLLAIFLSSQGFHAVQCQRVAHTHWLSGQRTLAVLIQNWAAKLYSVDIHPAAQLGQGLCLDHSLGIVIGETAVIEDDVTMLHGVTLGSTLKEAGDRHPKVRRGVTLGAHATVLGNIEIGASAMVAAGSVVRRAVPSGTVVAGVPAKAVFPQK